MASLMVSPINTLAPVNALQQCMTQDCLQAASELDACMNQGGTLASCGGTGAPVASPILGGSGVLTVQPPASSSVVTSTAGASPEAGAPAPAVSTCWSLLWQNTTTDCYGPLDSLTWLALGGAALVAWLMFGGKH